MGGRGFGVKGDAFEEFGAVVTGEAGGVKALGGGTDDTARDGERTGGALGCGAVVRRYEGPVGSGDSRGIGGGVVGKRPGLARGEWKRARLGGFLECNAGAFLNRDTWDLWRGD